MDAQPNPKSQPEVPTRSAGRKSRGRRISLSHPPPLPDPTSHLRMSSANATPSKAADKAAEKTPAKEIVEKPSADKTPRKLSLLEEAASPEKKTPPSKRKKVSLLLTFAEVHF